MKCILRYELDEHGDIGVTLEEFDSLEEMDEFVYKFENSDEIRNHYINKINIFLRSVSAINYLSKNKADGKRENNGYVRGYYIDKYNKKRNIGLLYQEKLILDRHLFATLRRNLDDRRVLREIYDRKFFLLGSQYLKDELRRCVRYRDASTRVFIRDFVRMIENKNDQDKYFYVRNLCGVCNLVETYKKPQVKLKVVEVDKLSVIDGYKLEPDLRDQIITDPKEINEIMKYEPVSTEEREGVKVVDFAPEEFKYIFYKALDTGDFDMLFNLYSIRDIDLYTNLIRGKRK